MKWIVPVTIVLALPVIDSGCAQNSQESRPRAAPNREAIETPAGGDSIVTNALVARLASEDIPVQQGAQRQLEDACLRAARPGAEDDRLEICRAIVGRLGSKTPKPARIWMLRQLASIGGGESVEKLTELLDSRDPQIRESCRRALEHNPAPSAADALRAALEGADDSAWQVALINALAARRDQGSVSQLAELTRTDNPDVAAAAVAALGDVGGSDATEALSALWLETEGPLRERVAVALVCGAESLLDEGEREWPASICEDLYLSRVAWPTRLAALHCLAKAKWQPALARLLDLMLSEDPQMRGRAARLALSVPDEIVTLMLATVVPDVPADVQALLIEGLSERSDGITRKLARRTMESPEQNVRIATLRALGRVGDGATVMVLARAAARADAAAADNTDAVAADPADSVAAGPRAGREREAARASLSRLSGEDIDPTILATMERQTDATLRCELIKALAARRYRPAIPALLAASKNQDESVQVAALEALAVLAEETNLPALARRLLDVKGGRTREATENAVVETSLRIDDPKRRVEPVRSLLEGAEGAARESLARVLERIEKGLGDPGRTPD